MLLMLSLVLVLVLVLLLPVLMLLLVAAVTDADAELVKGAVLQCCFFGVEVVRAVLVMLELCAATCANLIAVFLLVEVGVLVVAWCHLFEGAMVLCWLLLVPILLVPV